MNGTELAGELERLVVSALPALVREEGATDRGRLYRAVMARVELMPTSQSLSDRL
jgi:hypothetical protein